MSVRIISLRDGGKEVGGGASKGQHLLICDGGDQEVKDEIIEINQLR